MDRFRRQRWFFGAIRGRRRIGKTALVQQALATHREDHQVGRRCLMVQLPDSTPADFAQVFRDAAFQSGLGGLIPKLNDVSTLPAIAGAIGSLCAKGVIVALDEFQICLRGPLRALPSLLQFQVDQLQDTETEGGLIVLGSVQAEMNSLLQDSRTPLFGRTTFNLNLGPWDLRTVFHVSDLHQADDPNRFLTLWTLFGGVPKFWRHFAEVEEVDRVPNWSDWAAEVCASLYLRTGAPLQQEGEMLLRHELRRTSLAILRVVAQRPRCSHADFRRALPEVTTPGPYLKTLTGDLQLIRKDLPLLAGDGTRRARYSVSDPFLRAWTAALQPACMAARTRPTREVTQLLIPRLSTLEGRAFEELVHLAIEEVSRAGSTDFPVTAPIGGYWKRPRRGGEIEIDLIARNDDTRRVRFGSCKRNPREHDDDSLASFRRHVQRFLRTDEGRRFSDWDQEWALYSPRFPSRQRDRLETAGWICRDLSDFRNRLGRSDAGATGAFIVSEKVAGRD
ncbi:MAG: hypothetical protein OXT71_03260 [Acidobacteriota bacterium]|nr:hypothetical protein [Acidobacteriota bacterium]